MMRNVYDFDKTIYAGDSSVHFYGYCLLRHPRMLLGLPGLCGAALLHYGFRRMTKTQMKQRIYRFLAVLPDIDGTVAAFWQSHERRVKAWYLAQKRDTDLIISASPEFLLAPVCRTLGVPLLASRVDKRTGVYDGLNCHGEEKVRRMYAAYPDCEIDAFYSDSLSDTPLARLAKHAFRVRGNRISSFFE